MSINMSESPYKGSGSLTRAQFLFYEMRTTAQLLVNGLSDEEIKKEIISDNLFQYPTEKSLEQMSRVCLHRLHGLNDESLITAIAQMDSTTAKQICLYAILILQPDVDRAPVPVVQLHIGAALLNNKDRDPESENTIQLICRQLIKMFDTDHHLLQSPKK